jgi:hypothetical protein
MLGLGWLTLKQAEEALHHGRLEEAHRLLSQPETVGHKGSSALLRQLAKSLVARGEQHLRHENPGSAWTDLVHAEKIGAADQDTARLRQSLTRQGLAEARKLLDAGEPVRAAQAVGRLQHGTARQADVELLEELARGWATARDQAAKGELAAALQTVERARQLLPRPPAPLERFRKDLQERQPVFAALLVQLHEAWAQERWRDVVDLAERVLAVAPQHGEARKARTRAWKALEPARAVGAPAPKEPEPGERFLLWVDGAGGYLVCLGNQVQLGQAAPDGEADIPLLADVSRNHASLRRDSEGYVLEAVRPVQVNGVLADRALLQPGDRLTLGNSCQVQFLQPVPVSASARLDLVSGHRLPLAVDGVLLMADTLVLGPGPQAHVIVPDLEKPVVLYRNKDGLGVRCPGECTVDGRPCRERGVLGETSRVRGEDFAFAVEPIGSTMGR